VYRREGQTLDQVLFSEPSTKMKEKIEQLRAEKLKKDMEDRLVTEVPARTEMVKRSEIDEFLNDKFGNSDK